VASTQSLSSGSRENFAPGQKPGTILVVDDNGDDFELLRLMFRRSNILNPVRTVDTVEKTICYLKGEGIYADREKYAFPILLLLDMHLPDGSGFDVLNWVKENRFKSPLSVVVLTGSDLGAIRQSYEKGAHSFLTKPLHFKDFENMVAHARGLKLTSISDGRILERE
jgi:CheY-like chemotaxis protein